MKTALNDRKPFCYLFQVFFLGPGAVVVGLLISMCMLLFMGLNPLEVCGQTLSKIVTDKYNLGEVLVKATPLIFTEKP